MASTDWRSLYPFESHFLEIRGYRCHYLDEGVGPVLLLLHGNPTWSFYWRELVKALRPQFRLIVPDHLGCGLSDKPSPRAYDYRLETRIGDLLMLVEKLDLGQITLLAHDWGGVIGMGAAVAAPERFSRFMLFNTAAFTGGPCPRWIRMCRTPLLGRIGVQGFNLFARAAIRMAVEHQERMTPAVRAGLLAPYDSWRHREAVYRFVADIPLLPSHPSYPTLARIEARLSLFRQSAVALVWGMRDWCFTPWFLRHFRVFFPQADVRQFDDAGHYVIEDAWERIIPLVKSFARSPATRPVKRESF